MSQPISAEHFARVMGRQPHLDDLERSNCPHAGEIGHWSCGWDWHLDRPVFATAHTVRPKDDNHD